MPDLKNSVFISYRPNPASYVARAIFQSLKARGYDVFMDVENIGEGEFGTIIQNQIKARPYFLLILTSGTVARFDQPQDWLRREIELAIAEKRKIIPLLIDEFKFNKTTKRYFTGKLAHVLNYQPVNIRPEDFDADLEKLCTRYLKPQLLIATEPTPSDEKPEVERRIDEAAAQPTPTKEELRAEAHYNRAIAHDENDYDGKIADYTEAIRLNPQFSEAYNNRGTIRNETGDLDGALADYNEAIRLDPQNAEAYVNRGAAYNDKGDFDNTIADYNEAIRLNPQTDGAYNNRGFVRYQQGDFDSALADCSEAIRLNPQFVEAYVTRGVTYFASGKFNQALDNFRESNKLFPDLDNALTGLAITQFELGDKEEAKQLWRSLVAKDKRYRDANWVGKELQWRPELVEAARKLIAEL